MYNIDEPFIRWKELEKILAIYNPLFKDVATDYSSLYVEIKRRVEIPVSDIKFVREDGSIISMGNGTVSYAKEEDDGK